MNTIKTQIRTGNEMLQNISTFFAFVISFLAEVWPLLLILLIVVILAR